MRMMVVAAVCVVMGSVQAMPQLGAPVNMTVPSMNNGLQVGPPSPALPCPALPCPVCARACVHVPPALPCPVCVLACVRVRVYVPRAPLSVYLLRTDSSSRSRGRL
jgi:hypothetical protein